MFALVAVGACSDSQAGSAVPVQDNSSSRSAEQSSSPNPPPDAGGTSALDPCSLLSYSEVSRFGEFEPEPKADEGLGARSCTYLPVRTDASDSPTLGVDVRDAQSVDTVNDEGMGIRFGNVAGRKAAQVPARGGCIVALETGPGSRVDVGVTGIDANEACDLASQLADVVEAKLPEG